MSPCNDPFCLMCASCLAALTAERARAERAEQERDVAQKAVSHLSQQAHLEWTRAEKAEADRDREATARQEAEQRLVFHVEQNSRMLAARYGETAKDAIDRAEALEVELATLRAQLTACETREREALDALHADIHARFIAMCTPALNTPTVHDVLNVIAMVNAAFYAARENRPENGSGAPVETP